VRGFDPSLTQVLPKPGFRPPITLIELPQALTGMWIAVWTMLPLITPGEPGAGVAGAVARRPPRAISLQASVSLLHTVDRDADRQRRVTGVALLEAGRDDRGGVSLPILITVLLLTPLFIPTTAASPGCSCSDPRRS